ncbi:DUF2058 family protein [Psychrosphaera sp. G1-22]|uniref:DUF2058 family protein n=1 Tax=Psychrosphaera algicola TaxID=3023714 RepID=A0ABT5FAR5_9GAMM|nr:DUF2058 family protein [Psychrosphaera sp. G1-22]MDC2888625.1 DUF2058 family protein [Psychrosphaera sp. G1-22]
MAQMSLQEQLLKAGLTNEKKAKKAKKPVKRIVILNVTLKQQLILRELNS